MKEIISTDKAPAAIGPYSQGVKAGGFLFLSGQIALDPKTMAVVEGDAVAQTEQVMKNMKEALGSQGLDFSDVVKTTVFIKDMNEFGRINEVYGRFFAKDAPARSCVEVARLPKDVLVEIEAIALLK
ncbi:MAG: RidA family protein [Synergistaceae bacterium]|jgi:2-iminobutanoate/2-iminopropanoate deaminase|nr:RidA family protein [Synergistaceae bacterium]MDD2351689.1 RidA family protein [Synergistaceae bacterium]MDD3319660.1 RidA family protein [Synergistaceae bacterium]MDD3673459.1 RidA family protein [Synergistaceae bacterium]MDD3964306.1 RidA family protein [Synergistaceae bacterium]